MVTTLVISVAWEVLYRGYLMWMLAPRIRAMFALIVAAAAYGVAHGYQNPKLFAGSLISALIFTTAYAVSHSLWWLVLIHAGLPMLMMTATVGAAGPPAAEADLAPS